jgi:hypothetical protein
MHHTARLDADGMAALNEFGHPAQQWLLIRANRKPRSSLYFYDLNREIDWIFIMENPGLPTLIAP